MALASAGPYATHLQLTADKQLCQHLTTQFFFYRPNALPDAQPTLSKGKIVVGLCLIHLLESWTLFHGVGSVCALERPLSQCDVLLNNVLFELDNEMFLKFVFLSSRFFSYDITLDVRDNFVVRTFDCLDLLYRMAQKQADGHC